MAPSITKKKRFSSYLTSTNLNYKHAPAFKVFYLFDVYRMLQKIEAVPGGKRLDKLVQSPL